MVERHLVGDRQNQPVLLQAVFGIGGGARFGAAGGVGIDGILAVDVGAAQAETAFAAPEPRHHDHPVADVDLAGPRDLDDLSRGLVPQAGRVLVAALEFSPRTTVRIVRVLRAERRGQHLDDHEVILRVGNGSVDQFAPLDAGDGNGLQVVSSPMGAA